MFFLTISKDSHQEDEADDILNMVIRNEEIIEADAGERLAHHRRRRIDIDLSGPCRI